MNEFLINSRTLHFIPDLLFKYIPLCLWSKLRGNRRQQWLFAERPTDARDNSYILFKWIREHHPEINVVYAIKKSAPDYEKIKDLGKVVGFGSWAHWYYFITSSICCSTQWDIGIPNSLCYILMRNVMPPKSKRVFLQHGITKDFMPQGRKHKLNADIFVCGAYPEWEYINKEFGYSDGEVRYLGFSRFDFLIDTSSKRQILFMPTWRLGQHTESNFESTLYFQKISSLLSSPRLKDYLVRSNTELVYFVHPSIREKKKCFEKFANDNIRILNNEDYDLQKLICSANLLLTDFSSIYFDFAYQGKPVVYYHFDYDDYRREHYAEGYFNYDKDGFGPIETDEENVITTITSIANNDWQVAEEYKKRAERFFTIRDRNNCQRHFDVLCELERQQK